MSKLRDRGGVEYGRRCRWRRGGAGVDVTPCVGRHRYINGTPRRIVVLVIVIRRGIRVVMRAGWILRE
jgi:hypothetical protein